MGGIERNVYSLVLSADVIRQIDLLSRTEGSSRSSLVNRILANHVSMTQPEHYTAQVVTYMSQILDRSMFEQVPVLSEGQIVVSFPLCFRYNPKMRCLISLSTTDSVTLAQIKMNVRSTNTQLHELLRDFCKSFSSDCLMQFEENNGFCKDLLLIAPVPSSDAQAAALHLNELMQSLHQSLANHLLKSLNQVATRRNRIGTPK